MLNIKPFVTETRLSKIYIKMFKPTITEMNLHLRRLALSSGKVADLRILKSTTSDQFIDIEIYYYQNEFALSKAAVVH